MRSFLAPVIPYSTSLAFFLFMHSATTEIYTLSLHDALPISHKPVAYFTDMAKEAGLTMMNVFGGEKTKKYIIETTGTGVAILDYDNDGWPDIFIVNGTKLEGVPAEKAPMNHLYHNNHDGTCTDVAEMDG